MWMCLLKTYAETHGPRVMLLGGNGMKNCNILVIAHIAFKIISLLHFFFTFGASFKIHNAPYYTHSDKKLFNI